MKTKYTVISNDELPEKFRDDLYREDEYRGFLVRMENGEIVEIVGEDGGCPEDQLLCRNWRWVAPALNAAYERGKNER